MSKMFIACLMLGVVVLWGCQGQKEKVEESSGMRIPTPGGTDLNAIFDAPPGGGPFPILVCAPGEGYHMGLPLFQRLVQAALNEGFGTLRFDWSFYTLRTNMSEDLDIEKEELTAALDYAKSLPGVDTTRIFLVGKSIGSLLAIEATLERDDIRGLVILTPALHEPVPPYEVDERASRLQEVTVPVLIISGRSDPFSRVDVLNDLVEQLPQKVEVVFLDGDHRLRGKTNKETGVNENAAARAIVEFAREHL